MLSKGNASVSISRALKGNKDCADGKSKKEGSKVTPAHSLPFTKSQNQRYTWKLVFV